MLLEWSSSHTIKRRRRSNNCDLVRQIVGPSQTGNDKLFVILGTYLVEVWFNSSSVEICQLEMSPLMKPEITTNTSTRMLMTVKILFIMVDSFTPNASTPFEKRRVCRVIAMIMTMTMSAVLLLLWLCANESVLPRYLKVAGPTRWQRYPGTVPGPWGPWQHLLENMLKCGPRWGHQMSHSTPAQHLMSLEGDNVR